MAESKIVIDSSDIELAEKRAIELKKELQSLNKTIKSLGAGNQSRIDENIKTFNQLADSAKKLNPAIKENADELSKLSQSAAQLDKEQEELIKTQQAQEKITKELTGTYEKLNEELKEQKKVLREANTETDRGAKEAAEASKRIKELTNQTKDFQRAARGANSTLTAAKGSYEALQLETAELTRKLRSLEGGIDGTSKEFKDLQRQIDQNNAKLKRFDASIGQNFRNVGNYQSALKGATTGLISFGSALGVGAPLFLLAQGVISAANEIRNFDQQLIAIGKTTNIQGEQLQEFGKQIRLLGLSLDGISITGLAQSAEIAGQLGIRGAENILKFSETVQKLTLTSNILGEEGAREFAKFIEVSTDSVINADRLGSVITELGNNFATTESAILKNTVEIQKGIAAYETSAELVLALGAATNALGSEAEASRSAIQTVFKILNDGINTGKNLNQILKITGLTQEEIGRQFQEDGVVVFQRFVEGLNNAANEGSNLSLLLEDLGVKEKRAFTVVGTLAKNYGVLENAISRASKEYELNSALNTEVEAANLSLNSSINDVSDAWTAFITSLDQGQGPLSSATKGVLGFFESFFRGLSAINDGTEEVNGFLAVITPFLAVVEVGSRKAEEGLEKVADQTSIATQAQFLYNEAIENGIDTFAAYSNTAASSLDQNTNKTKILVEIQKLYNDELKDTEGNTEDLLSTQINLNVGLSTYQTLLDNLNANELFDFNQLLRDINQSLEETGTLAPSVLRDIRNILNPREDQQFDQDIAGLFGVDLDLLEENTDKAAEVAQGYRDDEVRATQDAEEAKREAISQTFQLLSSLATAAANNENIRLEEQARKIEERYDAEIAAAGDNEKAVTKLEEKKAQELAKIKTKQAENDKKAAVIQSIINTALAVTSALPNLILAAVVGAFGLAQTAIIASQPIPKFEKGGKHKDGGPAIFNEKGPELIKTPDGNFSMFESSGPMIGNFPKNTEFFSAPDSERMIKDMELRKSEAINVEAQKRISASLVPDININTDTQQMLEKMDMLIKEQRKKKPVAIKIEQDGKTNTMLRYKHKWNLKVN